MAGMITGLAIDLRKREAMGKSEVERLSSMDWLAVAIGNLGGVVPAAKALKVSRQTIHAWLTYGLADVSFDKIVRLSEGGDVPMEYLARRLFRDSFNTK